VPVNGTNLVNFRRKTLKSQHGICWKKTWKVREMYCWGWLRTLYKRKTIHWWYITCRWIKHHTTRKTLSHERSSKHVSSITIYNYIHLKVRSAGTTKPLSTWCYDNCGKGTLPESRSSRRWSLTMYVHKIRALWVVFGWWPTQIREGEGNCLRTLLTGGWQQWKRDNNTHF